MTLSIAPLNTPTQKSFQAVNPANGQRLEGYYPFNNSADADAAASAAARVFADYSALSDTRRATFLDTIAAELELLRSEIVARAMLETALPEARLNGELSRTTGQLALFANVLREGSWVRATIDTAMPERQPLPRPDIRSCYVPLGPVVVFGASNFPLAFSVAGGDTASALAAGCPVIVKAHSAHPGTSYLVGQAIHSALAQCGLPASVFSLLYGNGTEVGRHLVQHRDVKAVGFTGSTYAGRSLFDLASSRPQPIPFYGELGSINPVFMLPSALEKDPGAMAKAYVGSLTLGGGQFCTNPGLVIGIASPALEQFKQAVKQEVELVPAHALLTGSIASSYSKGVARASHSSGVSCVGDGQKAEGERVQASVFSVSAEDWLSQAHLHEEVFGPMGVVIECQDSVEMLMLASQLEGQLTATVQADKSDYGLAEVLSKRLVQCCGRLLYNGWPTGVEVCHAMTHGGPYPSSTDSRSTSVGSRAIERWVRTVSFQNTPDELLPKSLQSDNPDNIWRMVNTDWSQH